MAKSVLYHRPDPRDAHIGLPQLAIVKRQQLTSCDSDLQNLIDSLTSGQPTTGKDKEYIKLLPHQEQQHWLQGLLEQRASFNKPSRVHYQHNFVFHRSLVLLWYKINMWLRTYQQELTIIAFLSITRKFSEKIKM